MQRICTVNGIRTHGEGSTDLLGSELSARGFDVTDIDQKVRHTWNVWNKRKVAKDVEEVLDYSLDGDVLIGHSYGCYKIALAMKQRNYKAVFLFRPAMSKYYQFPLTAKNTAVYCVHASSDWVIWFGSLVPHHAFGIAGTVGFSDPLVNNIRSKGRWNHSTDFHPPDVRQAWVDYIEELYPAIL